jgi:hypothetical protein
MSLSTLSGLVDPEILNSSGEVDFFKLKFRDDKSLKDKLDNYCILNYVQLIKRNYPKVKLKPDKKKNSMSSLMMNQKIIYNVFKKNFFIITHLFFLFNNVIFIK